MVAASKMTASKKRSSADTIEKDSQRGDAKEYLEVIDSLTTPLTNLNVIQDPAWLDEITILVTSNTDKAALTASATELFAKRNHVVACRWKIRIRDVHLHVELKMLYTMKKPIHLYLHILYSTDLLKFWITQTEMLYGGWPTVPLAECIPSPGRTRHGAEAINRPITQAKGINKLIIDLPFHPEYINVQLVDRSGNVLLADIWPPENNLEIEWITDNEGNHLHKKIFHYSIPIGIMKSQHDNSVTLTREFLPMQKKINMPLIWCLW
ncbi:unnamed protein product [Phytophthora fragariaefolia]|uniref:Unnamed protein product n=1 Tax=Phytophthora fragariaefolia TaxID=1490495 RepID=A0A9W6WS02_9STRA|nr:unnamed protein product [Phytophthora fragariaefolia]